MKNLKRTITIIAIAVFVLTGGALAASKLLLPCQITANGQTLVTVKNEEVARMVVRRIIASYVPQDSTLENVTLDKELRMETVSISDAFNRDNLMTGSEAIEYLTDANKSEDGIFKTTIKSASVKEEKFTPEIEYKLDEDMFAGESRVESEGKAGVKNVTYQLTSVNGDVKSETKVSEEVINEGEAKVVYKGNLGLPEGEDWKTYEGAPIYKDGDEVVKTAKQYLGCPYKYGGKSFTKGIDCVQYVRNIYRMYGVNVPNRHSDIRRFGTGVSLKNARPGDIICYKHHVGIYVGNGKMAEATTHHGTRIGKVRKGVITVRRVKKH